MYKLIILDIQSKFKSYTIRTNANKTRATHSKLAATGDDTNCTDAEIQLKAANKIRTHRGRRRSTGGRFLEHLNPDAAPTDGATVSRNVRD